MTSYPAVAALCVCTALHPAASIRAQQPPPSPAADSVHRDSLAALPPAVLIGRVTDSSGVGLPSAEITLSHSDRIRAITNDSGQFRITGLPPGTNVFNVRRIGFEAATFTAVLKPGKTHRATFPLSMTAHELPTVAVSDTAIPTHWLDQFERRRSTARGTFITRADIVRRGARTGTDIVRSVAGIRLVPLRGGAGNQVVMTRGAGARQCLPTMFVHNMPYSGTLDDFIAEDVEAVEVYVGVSEIPAELDKNGKGICGAIVVWTRDPRKAP
ncbi:MAG TPA: carboxypeptidase regulatory-like domain-containing protein [Gemmatimonadaceae bacterium]